MAKKTPPGLKPNVAGEPRRGGRVKGQPNKITVQMREVIMEAFDKLGGVDYLVKVGQQDPRVFCTLLGKLIPARLDVETTVKWDAIIQEALDSRSQDAAAGRN